MSKRPRRLRKLASTASSRAKGTRCVPVFGRKPGVAGALRLHFNDSRCRNGRSWRSSPTPRAAGWCAGSHLRARFFNRRIAVAQVGKIIQRFEEKGFTLAGLKLLRPTAELAAQYAPKQLNGRGSAAAVRTPCGRHYAEHNGRHFFPKLVRFLASGPVFAMVPLGCARCPVRQATA